MKRRGITLLLGLLPTPLLANTLELAATPSLSAYHSTAPLAASDQADYEGRGRVALGLTMSGHGCQAEWRGSATREGDEKHAEGRLNEAFCASAWQGLDLTLGKRRLAWGVGYGYRPLDLLQLDDRQQLAPNPSEGVPQASAEWFGLSDSLALIYSNALDWQQNRLASSPEAWSLRYFHGGEALDLMALLHHDAARDAVVGVGLAWVVDDAWAVHAELTRQQRYTRLDVPGLGALAAGEQVQTQERENGTKALIGGQWSSAEGWTLIGEYWWDESAPTHASWRHSLDLITLAQQAPQQLPAGSTSALADLTQALGTLNQAASLQPHNLFLRLAYDGERWDPALELLIHPEDGGLATTLRLGRELGSAQRLEFGWRHLDGPADALFANLAERDRLYLDWQTALGW